MSAVFISDPALARPFAAWLDAERALAADAPRLAGHAETFASDLRASMDAVDALDHRFEALCGPAPWLRDDRATRPAPP